MLHRGVHRCNDSLFPGGPGKTWSAEDFVSLIDDLEERAFGPLPDETWVCIPGTATTPPAAPRGHHCRGGAQGAGETRPARSGPRPPRPDDPTDVPITITLQ